MSRKSEKSRYTKRSASRFRSGLEEAFAKAVPRKRFKYEPYVVPYVMHRNYVPDFVDEDTGVLIECKGYFRAGDTMKYKAVRDTVDRELIFVLSDPNKKVRKGAKITMGQWCSKEGFKFFTVQQVEELMDYVTDNG